MSTPEQPTQSVTITFKSLGAYPPVSLVAAFTNPPWQPQELDYVTQHESNGDAKYEFSKTFEIPEGEWQYKFHLGSGAWVCDESVETGKTVPNVPCRGGLLTVPNSHGQRRQP